MVKGTAVPSGIGVSLLMCLLVSCSLLTAQDRPTSPQKAGEIHGVINYCGPSGNSGLTVQIPGRSFQAKLAASGSFTLYYVPPGSHTLQVDIPGRPAYAIPGVIVADNHVTDLGTVAICRDTDVDGYEEGADCDDNNISVHPGATELCDGIDNNCDGQVDEGCNACTDADNDGFFAQAGCLTALDCNDNDPTVRPNAAELCDGIDNDCDAQIDEGFDLMSDPSNCGSCGTTCSFANASSSCVGGTCEFGACLEGFADCNQTEADGCECLVDADGDGYGVGVDCDDNNASVYPGNVELCDGLDNNCDGQVDEGSLCSDGYVCRSGQCVQLQ